MATSEAAMPIVTVKVLKGYAGVTHMRLGSRVIDAARPIVVAPAEAFSVSIEEVARENYLRGGVMRVINLRMAVNRKRPELHLGALARGPDANAE